MTQFNFDANEYEPNTGAAPQLPVSDSQGLAVVITDTEFVPTQKDPNNQMLVLSLKVVEGPHLNCEGIHRINFIHDNEITQRIGRQELSSICHVIGLGAHRFADTSELHGRSFRVVTVMDKPELGYTKVKSILDINGEKPKRGQPAPAAVTTLSLIHI